MIEPRPVQFWIATGAGCSCEPPAVLFPFRSLFAWRSAGVTLATATRIILEIVARSPDRSALLFCRADGWSGGFSLLWNGGNRRLAKISRPASTPPGPSFTPLFRHAALTPHREARMSSKLTLSQWHCWNTAVFLSFGQPHHDSSLAARCVARDPAYLRRCGSQFAGVAGASERVSCGLLSIHSFQRRSERDGRSRISGGIDTAVGARWLQHQLPPLRTASWGTRVNTLQISDLIRRTLVSSRGPLRNYRG